MKVIRFKVVRNQLFWQELQPWIILLDLVLIDSKTLR